MPIHIRRLELIGALGRCDCCVAVRGTGAAAGDAGGRVYLRRIGR